MQVASVFFVRSPTRSYGRLNTRFTSTIFGIDGLTKTMETIISFRCKLVLSVGLCSCAAWQQAQNEKNEFCQPKVIEMEYSGQQKNGLVDGRVCVFLSTVQMNGEPHAFQNYPIDIFRSFHRRKGRVFSCGLYGLSSINHSAFFLSVAIVFFVFEPFTFSISRSYTA